MEATTNTSRHDRTPAATQTNGDDLRRAVNWVLNDRIFADVSVHGNVKWTSLALVRLAMFWVWSAETGLVAAANAAIAQVKKLFGSVAVKSYQALTDALIRYGPQLLAKLCRRMHELLQEVGGTGWRVGLWLPLAVDGSRTSVPRTASNEQRFCKPAKKKTKNKKKNANKRSRKANQQRSKRRRKKHYNPQAVGPQMWLTLLWHIGLRLPWCWKVGPSFDSERGHLQAMLDEQTFPENTLFCGDAGFYGYDFWRSILDRGHQFLVRVGSNVRLLTNLGVVRLRGDVVYCWPIANIK